MNEIIKITKQEIGTQELNSVNARDIHSYLEVKTKFSMWIQRAIEKYDFKENIDYVVIIPNFGNNSRGRPEQDYIVTMDMAKELAMLENNPKGKETRKYFISIEKKYNIQLSDAQSVLGAIVEMSKTNQMLVENIFKANSSLMTIKDEIAKQKEEIKEIKKYSEASHVNTHYARESMARVGETTQNLIEAGYEMKVTAETILKKINRTTIDAEQQTLISNTVSKRANELKDLYALDLKYIKIIIWTKLSERFNVNTYREIKTEDFYKAMQFLDYVDIKNQDLEIVEGR